MTECSVIALQCSNARITLDNGIKQCYHEFHYFKGCFKLKYVQKKVEAPRLAFSNRNVVFVSSSTFLSLLRAEQQVERNKVECNAAK
jgi:hypothetical protein